MADLKKPAESEFNADAYMKELVPFYAFKDSEKYKDDIFVSVGNKNYQIKRGETVYIPRNVALVLERSMKQKNATADLIHEHSGRFLEESKYV